MVKKKNRKRTNNTIKTSEIMDGLTYRNEFETDVLDEYIGEYYITGDNKVAIQGREEKREISK